MAIVDDPTTRAIIRQIEWLGYAVNSMRLLVHGGESRYRFTAWLADNNPGGVYQGGEQFVAEADTAYEAACQLAAMVGVELEDG